MAFLFVRADKDQFPCNAINFAVLNNKLNFKTKINIKKLTVLSLLCMGLALTSCKKERECECSITETTTSGSSTTTSTSKTVVTIDKIKKGAAKDLCYSTERNMTATGYMSTTIADCELK